MKPKSGLPTLWHILGFLKPYKLRLLFASFALLFTAGVTLSMGKGVQVLIDQGFGGNVADLRSSIALLLTLGAAMAAGTFMRFYMVSWLGERVSGDIRLAVFNNIVRLNPGYFETNRSGEIMSRLTTDTTLLQTIIGSSLSMALRSTLTLSGALVMMFITNLQLSLYITVGIPLVLAPVLIFGRRVRKLSNRSQDSIASVGTYAGEIIQNIKVVQSYSQESYESSAFSREVERAFSIARKRIFTRSLLIGVAIFILFLSMSAMLWSGGRSVISGGMTGGELGAFVFYALMVGSGVATIAEVWGELQRAAGAAERLLDLLNTKSLINDVGQTSMVLKEDQPEVSFQHVSFFYPTRPEHAALDDFSLHIERGKSLALVGPSGAGKSTVFELLQRFYDPQQGKVVLDGNDLRALSLKQLRSQMALVPQQPTLFTADVRYNIAYGKSDVSDEEVFAAARAAHAHDFIRALPDGYASHLGEQGVRLSGGQRQRIALARAILNDPKILLLDEATSALDTESEQQVQAALEELMVERTTVIIAHRLSTILHADKIAVMDNGKVVATGTHQQLLASNSLYARLASLQFREPVPKANPASE